MEERENHSPYATKVVIGLFIVELLTIMVFPKMSLMWIVGVASIIFTFPVLLALLKLKEKEAKRNGE